MNEPQISTDDTDPSAEGATEPSLARKGQEEGGHNSGILSPEGATERDPFDL
jgi:hypothetical protein